MSTRAGILDNQVLTPKLKSLHTFISSPLVQSLLRLHPNELAIEKPNVLQERFEWFNWSSDTPKGWLELVYYYMTDSQDRSSSFFAASSEILSIPGALHLLLDQVKRLQMPRYPVTLKYIPPLIKETGMSPKKVHEVSRMATYVLEIIRTNGWDSSTLRVVDTGAGQVGSVATALTVYGRER